MTIPTAVQPLDLDKLPRYSVGVERCTMDRDDYEGEWLKRSDVAALIAQARAAQPESATGTTGGRVKTWRERIQDMKCDIPDVVAANTNDAVIRCAMKAEIADLRAQLAVKGQGEPVGEVMAKPDNEQGTLSWPRVVWTDGLFALPPVGTKLYLAAAPASAQPDRGAVQQNSSSNSSSNFPATLSPASQPVAPRDYLAWWTSIETDVRKSILVFAHREPERLHALVRQAYEAGQQSIMEVTVAPSDAKGKADAANAGGLTDEQIMRIAGDVRQHNAGSWPGDVTFARAVLAAQSTATSAASVPDALYQSVKDMQDAAYTFGDNCQEAVRVALDGVLDAMREIDAETAAHPDDAAVDRFAAAMKVKMAASRAKGRGGWGDKMQCPAERLQAMLNDHLAKGDPVDVGNFAMMLWNRGERTATSTADAKDAARYRWWRRFFDGEIEMPDAMKEARTSEELDAAIDAAMAAAPSSEIGGAK